LDDSNTAVSADQETSICYFRIDGIVCFACVGILEGVAKGVPGVCDARVNYLTECLQVTTDSRFDAAALIAAVESRGYRATAVAEKESSRNSRPDEMRRTRQILLVTFILSVVLWWCDLLNLSPYIQLTLATAIQVIAARIFYIDAFHAVAAGTANMSVLVAIGTLTAYVFSIISMIFGIGQLFFPSSGTVVVFVLIGKYLERSAKIASSESIRDLVGSCPDEAVLLKNGDAVKIPVGDVRQNDRIRIPRNSVVATDGTIVTGETLIDESVLTGESALVKKTAGSKIFCGTINHNNDVEIVADCDYADNVYARMIAAIVRCLTGERAAIQRTADRLCARFVPVVLILAALTFLAWYFLFKPGDFYASVICTISVLIVACPCAMGIATPLSVSIGIGVLGRSGIVVKNPAALEALAKADTMVFDKTGTLTLGPDDTLREGSPVTVEALKKLGFNLVLLSGDSEEKTRRAAEACAIERWHAGLQPEDKAAIVRQLQESHTVAMVGDGINDLLSILSANVGIVIGRAAELNLENADIVLAQNKIAHLLKTVYISRVVLKNIKVSLFWALIYNIVGLGLAVGGIVTPIIASIAMSLSSLCVVLNARRMGIKGQRITIEKILQS
jgi:Cu+-exporting ATPase